MKNHLFATWNVFQFTKVIPLALRFVFPVSQSLQKQSRAVLIAVALAFVAWMPLQTSAGVLKILNPTPEAGDRFGRSVTAVGGNILVGAPNDQGDSGAAYLFDGATGDLLQTYLSPATDSTNFGASVAAAADGNVFISGGDGLSSNLYHFNVATGALIKTFADPDPGLSGFGRPVAVQGNELLVGGPTSNLAGPGFSGSAYLLDAATGNELQLFLPPSSPFVLQRFGGALGLTGDNVVIGNTGSSTTGNADEVYVFSASTGALLHTITSPNPGVFSDSFGTRLVVDGNNILVGARDDDTAGLNAGAAYLFDVTTGDLLQTFLNPTGASDLFGNSVAIRGNKVLVGANGNDGVGLNSGAAYLFDATTGELLDTFLGTTPGNGGFAGSGQVAFLGEDRVVISDQFDNTGAADAGAVFVFEIVPEPSMLMLSATTAVCLLGFGWRRREGMGSAMVCCDLN